MSSIYDKRVAFILVEDVVMNINFVIKKLLVIMSAKHFFNSVTIKKNQMKSSKCLYFFTSQSINGRIGRRGKNVGEK